MFVIFIQCLYWTKPSARPVPSFIKGCAPTWSRIWPVFQSRWTDRHHAQLKISILTNRNLKRRSGSWQIGKICLLVFLVSMMPHGKHQGSVTDLDERIWKLLKTLKHQVYKEEHFHHQTPTFIPSLLRHTIFVLIDSINFPTHQLPNINLNPLKFFIMKYSLILSMLTAAAIATPYINVEVVEENGLTNGDSNRHHRHKDDVRRRHGDRNHRRNGRSDRGDQEEDDISNGWFSKLWRNNNKDNEDRERGDRRNDHGNRRGRSDRNHRHSGRRERSDRDDRDV